MIPTKRERDGGDASLEQIYGALVGEDQNEEVSRNEEDASVSGVKLSNVRLKLIYDLEHNNLLPQGSYDNALATVQGGIAMQIFRSTPTPIP